MSYDSEANALKNDLVSGYHSLGNFGKNVADIAHLFPNPTHQQQLTALSSHAYGQSALYRQTVIDAYDAGIPLKPYSGSSKNWNGAVDYCLNQSARQYKKASNYNRSSSYGSSYATPGVGSYSGGSGYRMRCNGCSRSDFTLDVPAVLCKYCNSSLTVLGRI
eukprot:91301_1